jgi:pentatricopeptide repeat protein
MFRNFVRCSACQSTHRLFGVSFSSNSFIDLTGLYRKAKRSKNFAPAMKEAVELLEGNKLPVKQALAAINIFKSNKRPDLCLNVIDSFPPDKLGAMHFNSAIYACEKGNMQSNGTQWETALQLFEQMKQYGFERDIYTFNGTISACAKARQWEKALQLFEEMERDGVERNTITFNATISACERGGQWEKALELFEQMKRSGVERNTKTFKSAISACGKQGEWRAAEIIFKDMESSGVARDVATYGVMMNVLGNAGQLAAVDELFLAAKEKFFAEAWDRFHRERLLDLHDHSVHMARAATRLVLRTPGSPVKGFIMGKGNISGLDGPKLMSAVQEELSAQVPPIGSKVDTRDPQLLLVDQDDLAAWVAAQQK